MEQQIVECIPNFSEGRRIEVVDAIFDAIQQVEGTKILDRTSDADHNRSVITFIGNPTAIVEGAFQAIAKASELIDMNTHEGVHPCIGATDVVPFVPIQGVTMQDCIRLAHQLGNKVATDLGIPVYLYEEAATQPERKNLAYIRRGGYAHLKHVIATEFSRKPDYGGAKLPKAGATVIGARKPLIAWNVYLTTEDVMIAKKIAKKIRYSSGGLPHVKALGLFVNGKAQVSMNLTDYTKTGIPQVFEMIQEEASHYNVDVLESEFIGLIPQEALLELAQWAIRLPKLSKRQVLENVIYSF